MNAKPYLAISGLVFFVVGLLHLLRLFYRWPVQLGPWPVPHWLSFLALPLAWGFAFWAYRLHQR